MAGKTSPITLIQISDLHIGPSPLPVRGFPVRKNFTDILKCIELEKADLLILSGDLAAENGEIQAYQWLLKRLGKISIPWVIMAGNHDSLENLNAVFTLKEWIKNGQLYFECEVGGHPLFFLDTSSHSLPKEQIRWLKKESPKHLPRQILLFMHHPPVAMDCAFMDRVYPLLNRDSVWPQISGVSNMPHVFCGHYHNEKTRVLHGKTVHLTPSSMMQMDSKSTGYEVASDRPGWRIIKWDGRNLRTSVRYLPLRKYGDRNSFSMHLQ